MKLHRFAPLTVLFALANLYAAPQDDQYVAGPDSELHADVPRGKVVPMPSFQSKIYEGTTREWWLYVPAKYDAAKPACVMVFQDGGGSKGDPKQAGPQNATYVFDNLIAAKQMPVTIGIFITPGSFPASDPNQKPRSNRSVEYDTPDGTFARFLLEEILPEVSKQYNLSEKPEERAICGNSSGGICAFKVAWERPDAFQKVVSHIGSFTNIRGGNIYQDAVRQDGSQSLRSRLYDAGAKEAARTPPQNSGLFTGWQERHRQSGGQLARSQSGNGRLPQARGLGLPVCLRRRNAQWQAWHGNLSRHDALAVARCEAGMR